MRRTGHEGGCGLNAAATGATHGMATPVRRTVRRTPKTISHALDRASHSAAATTRGAGQGDVRRTGHESGGGLSAAATGATHGMTPPQPSPYRFARGGGRSLVFAIFALVQHFV
ncbi:MAG: hypothetical protein R3A44_19490 [Caldilineaceae bacterium]